MAILLTSLYRGSPNGLIKAQDDTSSTVLYPLMVNSVGIDTAPKVSSTKLSFNASTGQITATDFNSTSDVNLKKNIQKISSALSKVLQMNGVTFNWIDNDRDSIGVIAQEIEKVFPELVSNEQNKKTVRYNGLVAVLLEAVKEQNCIIKSQESRIGDLENKINKLRLDTST